MSTVDNRNAIEGVSGFVAALVTFTTTHNQRHEMENMKHLRARATAETIDMVALWAGSAALLAVSYYGILWLAGQMLGGK